MNRAILVIVVLFVTCLTGLAAESPPIAVDSECTVPRWYRVCVPTVSLKWEWDQSWGTDEATQVTLRIAGVNNTPTEQTFQKPKAEYIWNVYTQSTDFHEDVYEVTLIFKNAAGGPVTTKTARFDLIAGPFTGASVLTSDKKSTAWQRMHDGSLISYDHTWRLDTSSAESATLTWHFNEEPVQAMDLGTSATGYYPWRTVGWEKGDYELRLMFGETPAWTAQLTLFPDDTLLLVR